MSSASFMFKPKTCMINKTFSVSFPFDALSVSEMSSMSFVTLVKLAIMFARNPGNPATPQETVRAALA